MTEQAAKRARRSVDFNERTAEPAGSSSDRASEVALVAGLFLAKRTGEARERLSTLVSAVSVLPRPQEAVDVLTFALAGLTCQQLRQHETADDLFARGANALLSYLEAGAAQDDGMIMARIAEFPIPFLAAVASMASCLDDVKVKPWQLFSLDLERILLRETPDVPEDDGGTGKAAAVVAESKRSGKEDVGGSWVRCANDRVMLIFHTKIGTSLVLAEKGSQGIFHFSTSEKAEQCLCDVSGEALAGAGEEAIHSLIATIKQGGGEVVARGWSWGSWRTVSATSKAHDAGLIKITHTDWPPLSDLVLTDNGFVFHGVKKMLIVEDGCVISGRDAEVQMEPPGEDLRNQPELTFRFGLAIGIAMLPGADAERIGNEGMVLRNLARKLKGLSAVDEMATRAEILAAGGDDLHIAAASGRLEDVKLHISKSEKCRKKCRKSAHFELGDRVQVAEGYESVGDAGSGPLYPDDVGVVVTASGRKVRVEFNGTGWWYETRALMLADDDDCALDRTEGCRCLNCVNRSDHRGYTALQLAAMRFANGGHLKVLEALIQSGARICRTGKGDLTAVNYLLRSPAALAQEKPPTAFLRAVDLLCRPVDDGYPQQARKLDAAFLLRACECEAPNAILVVDTLLNNLLEDHHADAMSAKDIEDLSMACKKVCKIFQSTGYLYLRRAAGTAAARLLSISNVQQVVHSDTNFCGLNHTDMYEEFIPPLISLSALGFAYNSGKVLVSHQAFEPFSGVQTSLSFKHLLSQGWKVHYSELYSHATQVEDLDPGKNAQTVAKCRNTGVQSPALAAPWF